MTKVSCSVDHFPQKHLKSPFFDLVQLYFFLMIHKIHIILAQLGLVVTFLKKKSFSENILSFPILFETLTVISVPRKIFSWDPLCGLYIVQNQNTKVLVFFFFFNTFYFSSVECTMELRERAGLQERSLKNWWGLEARFGLVYQMSHNEKLNFFFAQSKVRKGPPRAWL